MVSCRQSGRRWPWCYGYSHSKFFAPHLWGLDHTNCVNVNSLNSGFKWPVVVWGSRGAQERPSQCTQWSNDPLKLDRHRRSVQLIWKLTWWLKWEELWIQPGGYFHPSNDSTEKSWERWEQSRRYLTNFGAQDRPSVWFREDRTNWSRGL